MTPQRSIVVLGLITKMPVAGVVWQTLHYLLGFERLGYRAYYVETHARTPSMLMLSERDDSSARAASFLAAVMRRFGFGGRWAFHALHVDGRCYGMSESELQRLYGSAELLIDLHGGTLPQPALTATDRLVYLETDPGQPQVELSHGVRATAEFLEQHCAHFTFAENYGADDCGLPVSDQFRFQPTRQPVVCELWDSPTVPQRLEFTTIGNWRQAWRDVWLDGETYGWSKDQQFGKMLDLPERVGRRFELALASYDDQDQRKLEQHGWKVVPALSFSTDLERYRAYISDSFGEFTVAKDQNVRLRTGWFSDRSATYLASGRPVITEDTGFGRALPTGCGLFAFSSLEQAADAVQRIDREPWVHQRAARELAREFFSAELVLGELLDRVGVTIPRRPRPARWNPFAPEMVITPVSRRPLKLADETLRVVGSAPPGTRAPRDPEAPVVSIVTVCHDGLAFTRMSVESVLAAGSEPAFELLIVDNGSADGTLEYLATASERDPRVHVIANPRNVGFPAACNQGLALARADTFVLLNNDTMVAPGWLGRLVTPLANRDIGLAGAVTNRIGNEAEVATAYETWGGFLHEARARAHSHRRRLLEVPALTMFCLAMRREVYEHLGPLDGGYGIGMLEDDDYSMRASRAGYRLVCAEDVLVHHFGEATFGALYADGERARILERNKQRFEQRWGRPWQPYARRSDASYEAMIEDVRRRLSSALPDHGTVLVVSKGDERLVEIPGRRAWHFPRTAEGAWAGHHPADSADAIARLEDLRSAGATHIAFPRTAFWWLDHYEGLSQHLAREHREVLRDDACVLFALEARAVDTSDESAEPVSGVTG